MLLLRAKYLLCHLCPYGCTCTHTLLERYSTHYFRRKLECPVELYVNNSVIEYILLDKMFFLITNSVEVMQRITLLIYHRDVYLIYNMHILMDERKVPEIPSDINL